MSSRSSEKESALLERVGLLIVQTLAPSLVGERHHCDHGVVGAVGRGDHGALVDQQVVGVAIISGDVGHHEATVRTTVLVEA